MDGKLKEGGKWLKNKALASFITTWKERRE